MSISPAPSPPRYPNPCIQENKQAIESLEKQISKEIKGSYAFTGGRQERDEKFKELFTDFFKELRGPEPLVNETAQAMADRFIERPDISYSYTPCGNPFQTCYEPIPELALALESIIEKEYGLQDQFLEALDSNGKQISDLELKDRDTQYRTYYVVCRLFPRCVDTLRAIFKDLLIIEWLRQDSGQYRLVHADNGEVASLWQVAKQSVEDQKAKDAKLSERHWQDFKTDLYQTASSGALSLATKKPQFVASQVAKLGMNVIGRQIDPEGRNKWIKGFNMLGSALVSKGLGGNTRELVTSLGVDVAELLQRPENTSKEKALLRGYGSALAKGAFLRDTKKLTSQILGFVASTGAEVLPKAKKSEAYRALRATLTNSDIHGHFIDKGVERYFREPEKPTPKVEELAQVEESKEKEQFDGQWLEDVFHEKLSHVAVEEQVAIETAQEINQKIDQLKRDISKKDEAIRIGTEHLNNLQSSGEVVDIAQYEVKKKSGDWRVYRNGEELYADNTSNAQKTCYEMIPELQKKYGSPIHTQKYKEASTALDRANSEKLKLVEALGSLQKKQLPPDMIEQYERGFIEYKQQLESQRQREVEGQRLTNKLMEKNRGVESAYNYLDDKIDGYNRHYKRDEYYSKLKSAVKNYNNALQERDAVVNQIYALNGDPKRISTPLEKIPPKATKWEKTKLWVDRNVEININLSTSMPLYQMKEPKSTGYTLLQEPTNPEPKTFTFQDTQELQNQQIFQENMSFRSANPTQGTTQHEISQQSANMGLLWGNGVDRNVQPPPVSTRQAIQSGIRELIEKPTLMQQAVRGFFNPDRGHLTPNERIEQNSQIFSGHAKPIIRGAGNLIDQLRSFGMLGVKRNKQGQLELAYDRTFYNKFSEWADGNLPTVDSRVELVASVANEFVLQSFLMPFFAVGRAKPLANRVLANPENFGRELRAIQGMQNPVHRSGIGNPWTEMFPMQPKKLAGRSVAKIEPKMIQAGKGINRSNNHQFVTWVEQGQTRTASIGEMSHAGTFHDRGGLTKAGRALDKKASRVGSVFPKPKGNVHEINAQGQKVLDEILNHPDKQVFFKKVKTQRYREGIDIRLPDGRGARFTKDGKEMIGFLEPRK